MLVPLIALAAPSKKDKEAVSNIVERSGQNLGGLLECDKQDLGDEYLTVLRNALTVYPNTDPIKVDALVRQVERQGKVIARLGFKSIPSPTAEDIERQERACKSQIADASRDLGTLNRFILK